MWIKDKSIKPAPNSWAVIAIRVDEESIDYHTAIFNITGVEGDNTFVLANDDIGQVFELDQIEAYQPFERLN
ncbi:MULTISPECIES: hypothetical protein [Acinetobacter]|uniref:hypothetical protein n=1 Tax=Acinetobacter TaxID=469 RepID=UPI0019005D44|nr:hypothetical protein [Acinetobacter bereziniae]MBJ8552702.1 hypothetical protein [Acinetobacter bereziniae]